MDNLENFVFNKLTEKISQFEKNTGEKAPFHIDSTGTKYILDDDNNEMFKKCQNCDGKGFSVSTGSTFFCFMCEGTGYVDWITEMIGKNKDNLWNAGFSGYSAATGYAVGSGGFLMPQPSGQGLTCGTAYIPNTPPLNYVGPAFTHSVNQPSIVKRITNFVRENISVILIIAGFLVWGGIFLI